jgi:hypothetical protein
MTLSPDRYLLLHSRETLQEEVDFEAGLKPYTGLAGLEEEWPDDTQPYKIVVIVSPDAAGVTSDFYYNGQVVYFGEFREEILASATLQRELQTLLERLCFRHKLSRIEYYDPDLKPVADAAAKTLDLQSLDATLKA